MVAGRLKKVDTTLAEVEPIVQTPEAWLEAELPETGEVWVDISQLGGASSKKAMRSAGRLLTKLDEAGLIAVLTGPIGLDGESRQESVARAQRIWELFEEHRPMLRIDFPRLPDTGYDPIAYPPDGPPHVPVSPKGAVKPKEHLGDWELSTLRELLGTRIALSHTRKVIVNLTYKCNNFCTFCAVGNRLHENGDYDFHQDVLKQYREKGVDLVDFDGGEPTIYPNLLRLIDYAKGLGYQQINITTNGRILAYPHIAKKILNSGLTSLLVSLHGPNAEVHEEQVQAKGAFRQTIKGIQNVVKMKPKWMDFGVNITFINTNWQYLPEFYSLMDKIGVRKINVQFLTPFGRAEENLVPEPADIAPTMMALIDTYKARIRTYLINVPWCFFPGYETYVTGDILKLQRNMVFVTQEKVNLFEYLAGTRERDERCDDCVHSVACDGFYSFAETFD
jgi:MoaA/NifB/PqqE/SkfB family radical SAM enzyme